MTHRTVTVLAAALVVLGALALLAQYDTRPPAPGGGLLLPALADDLDNVTQVAVVAAGSTPVATLQRDADGNWSVAEKYGYPADVDKVHHTLISLAESRIVEPKTANPDFHDRLGVEDVARADADGLAVILTGADAPVNVIVGDSEGASRRYVRVAEQDQSFLVDRDPEVGDTATDWLATAILAIPTSRLARVTVIHPDGETVGVSKADPDQANFDVEAIPAGRELQYASVANVMATVVSSLNLQDVEPRGDVDAPVTVTEFATFDGLVVTAESFERDDEPWVAFRTQYRPPADAADAVPAGADTDEDMPAGPVTDEPAAADFEAAAEPDQPADSATAAGDVPAEPADSGAIAGDVPAEPEDTGVDAAAEAEELDRRLADWRYRIASYQFDQMTRRMEDLLRDPPEDEPSED